MNKYVNVNALIRQITSPYTEYPVMIQIRKTIKEFIDTAPSIDIEPKCGEWKISNLPKGEMKYCSECGFGQYIKDERMYNFCPNCGARMKGAEMTEDLIRRSDAIGACAYETLECYEARKAIRALPSADRPQGWIPCSERLPDDNREVLISLEWGIDIGTYERGEWRSEWINHYDDDNVLAWMPLPKPWKGEEDE